jgi:hypothetical protein
MFVTEFLFVLVLALLSTVFFGFALGRYAPWPGFVWLFIILLLATWALGVWLRPLGQPVRGVYWASFVAAIVVVSLLLMVAASAPRPPRNKTREELKGVEIRPLTPAEEQLERERAEEQVAASLGFLFWVLMAVAVGRWWRTMRFPNLVSIARY